MIYFFSLHFLLLQCYNQRSQSIWPRTKKQEQVLPWHFFLLSFFSSHTHMHTHKRAYTPTIMLTVFDKLTSCFFHLPLKHVSYSLLFFHAGNLPTSAPHYHHHHTWRISLHLSCQLVPACCQLPPPQSLASKGQFSVTAALLAYSQNLMSM